MTVTGTTVSLALGLALNVRQRCALARNQCSDVWPRHSEDSMREHIRLHLKRQPCGHKPN
eukprot:2432337-Alexandrium_andersonii.AAC.2